MENSILKEATIRIVALTYSDDGWIAPLPRALKAVTKETAVWRPAPGVKSIWEITAHLSNYLESLVNGLEGKPPVKFNDWPKVDGSGNWNQLRDHVIAVSTRLEKRVASLSDEELARPAPGKKMARALSIGTIAVHDAYHSGQIVKLKQLYRAAAKQAGKSTKAQT